MRASRIILILVALVAGGLAAFLATRGGPPPETITVEAPAEIIEEKKTQILVASAPIGVGQRLSETVMVWQDWPELAVRPEFIDREVSPDALTDMTDAVARFEFFPGEPILERKLVRSAQGYLSAVIAKGMRAVSVEVDAASAAGGYIVPNDRVDVVLTRNADSGLVSETLLTNVKVMAINLRLGEAGTTGAPSGGEEDPRADVFQGSAIATLELTPAQGEAIVNASRIGTLALALRSMADFAATDVVRPDSSSRSIRLIRFGRDSDVMSTTMPTAASADVTPAAFPEPAATSADNFPTEVE